MRKAVILFAAIGFLVAGCGGGDSKTPVSLSGSVTNKGTKDISGGDVDVEMTDFAFKPTFLKGGTPGATVTVHLKNTGSNPHTFTSGAFGVDETVAPGQSTDVSVTLPQSGATEYHCKFHLASNGMQGAFFFKDGDSLNASGSSGSSSDQSNPYVPN